MNKKIFILAVAVLVMLVGGGVAYASIPDSSGVIHGCYATKDGALRVIDADAGQACAKGETGLSWNQTGPAGLAGLQGATGSQGAQGPAGVSGYEVDTYTPSANGSNGDNPRGSHSIIGGGYPSIQLYCLPGKVALSGGYSQNVAVTTGNISATEVYPFSDAGGSGYRFTFNGNASPLMSDVTVYVTCASVS